MGMPAGCALGPGGGGLVEHLDDEENVGNGAAPGWGGEGRYYERLHLVAKRPAVIRNRAGWEAR